MGSFLCSEELHGAKLDSVPEREIKQALEDAAIAERVEELEPEEWNLPPGGVFTVLMFGMTGAGKSALGNLMAGSNHFTSGDDTASVTNLDSVMRYDAPDHSLTILDSIGLGDTEIDQEKVVGSIRDVALSAPNGVDAMLFVMRNARITDDSIARLIYVTEFLWGSECLLNLYIVVTFASRYAQSREEANAWIDRQVEINWRFKHIYNLVGNNPNRFIFIDNPDSMSGEPEVEKRQTMSRTALMKVLCQHPRDVIPPFTHAMMKKAKEMLTEELEEAKVAETEIAEAHGVIASATPQKKSMIGNMKTLFRGSSPAPPKKLSPEEEKAAKEALAKAKAKKKLADQKLKNALWLVRKDESLQAEALRLATEATKNFGLRYEAKVEDATSATPGVVGAAKRLFKGLWNEKGKKDDKKVDQKKTPAAQSKQGATATAETIQQSVDAVVVKMKEHIGHLSEADLRNIFQSRLDFGETDAVPPVIFANFVKEVVSGASAFDIGGIWRRADKNCDGLLSFEEFASLFS